MDINDRTFEDVVDISRGVERLATGFQFTEGPVWHRGRGEVIFSDIPGDCMMRFNERYGVEVFRKPSNMANGNTWDREGRLLTCEHAAGRVTRTRADGTIEVIASHYEGKELNSPNDIVVKRDGSVYFTDPDFGRREYFGVKREKELDFQGVYRLDAERGDLTLLTDELGQPNGLTFSPDESLLYVDDTPAERIFVFDVSSDGRIGNGRIFAEVAGDGKGRPDGLKTDIAGNVYCAGPGGIHVFGPQGVLLGRVPITEQTANFTWGGEDMRDVFVTASTSLYRFRTRIPGPILVSGEAGA